MTRGSMREPLQSPTHRPSPHPTDTNSNSVMVHTDQKSNKGASTSFPGRAFVKRIMLKLARFVT